MTSSMKLFQVAHGSLLPGPGPKCITIFLLPRLLPNCLLRNLCFLCLFLGVAVSQTNNEQLPLGIQPVQHK